MSRLRVSLFGRFHVEYDGRPRTKSLDSRKVQELFTYLLLYRDRLHPRESLADFFWSENSSAQSRKYLRQALWQLQSSLKTGDDSAEENAVFVDSDWVGINKNSDIWLDVSELESVYAKVKGKRGDEIEPQTARELAQAVDLHRGPLLEGWYHDWCIFERERLQNIYLAMLNKLMTYYEATEEYEVGLLYGQRILRFDRAHERTHWRMMRLYYLAGDRTSALRQYQRCVNALEEELGVKPAKWTASLYEQLRSDQLQDAPPDARPTLVSDVAPVGNINRLQSLLNEFHNEVQLYINASGSGTGERPKADLYPAE